MILSYSEADKPKLRADGKIAPGPGQESVWDYPRPPRLEDVKQRVRVVFNGVTIAGSCVCLR